jgi:4-oxalocrotonate tautomerase
MPLIQLNVFEGELTPDQTKEVIRRVTEVITTVVSPKLREFTWVVLHEVKSGNWGVGGAPLGLEDIKRVIGS